MSPIFVEDGGKTWGVVSGCGVAVGLGLFLGLREPLLDLAADLADGRPAVGTLLGWLPLGGLATYGAAVLAGRGRREARGSSRKRPVDRLAIALLTLWVGLAISNVPGGRDDAVGRWEAQVARPGPDFAQASAWCLATVGLTAVWALVPAVLVYRGRTEKPPRHVTRRLQAAILAPPFAVLLVVLLVW